MGGAATSSSTSSGDVANRTVLISIFTIIVTVLFHHLTVKLEHILKRHRHLSEMLQHMYRELMILGMISFGLFVVESSALQIASSDRHLFETVHIMVVLVVIGYTVMTILLMCLSVWLSRHWDRLEEHDHTDYMEIKADFERIGSELERRGWFKRFFSISLRLQYFKRVEQIAFHDLRLHFIHSNHLSPEFSFARYLRKCKQHVFLQLGDIHSSSWMLLLVFLLLDMLFRNVALIEIPNSSTIYFRIIVMMMALCLCTVAVAVYMKTRHILNEVLCHSEMIDFDPCAARYYIEHWRDEEGEGNREHSISYTMADDDRHSTVHFRAESAAKQVARVFRVSQWGQTLDVPKLGAVPAPRSAAAKASSSADTTMPAEDFVLSSSSNHAARPWMHNLSKAEEDIAVELSPRAPQRRRYSVPTSEAISDQLPAPCLGPGPRLQRVQSVHVVKFDQLELFWFNSHVFMLRIMQISLFMLVFFYAIMFRFRDAIFASDGKSTWYLVVAMSLTAFIVIGFLALSIPIYTIIIHVGQLVDLDIVIEARRKGAQRSNNGRGRSMSVSRRGRQQAQMAASSLPLAPVQTPSGQSCALSRVSTMQLLSKDQRRRLQVATHMFGRSMQTTIAWLVLVHVAFLVCTLEPAALGVFDDWMAPLVCVAPTLFALEMCMKAWSMGLVYFRKDLLVALDALVVVSTLVLALLYVILPDFPAIAGTIVLLRLIPVVRVARSGRIMLHRRSEEIENDLLRRNSLQATYTFNEPEQVDAVELGLGVGNLRHRPSSEDLGQVEGFSDIQLSPMPTITSDQSASKDSQPNEPA